MTISSCFVSHGYVAEAVGYAIKADGTKEKRARRSVVVSGDTTYSKALSTMSKGASVLVHEVIDVCLDGLS